MLEITGIFCGMVHQPKYFWGYRANAGTELMYIKKLRVSPLGQA